MSDRHHTTSHEIERYAGLFAKRTHQMRSSAMRDLMAITARPGGDLARRRPARHLDVPAGDVRRPDGPDRPRIAARAALQYGPTEGFEETKERIVGRDGRGGDARRSRRHDRDDRRPAGDRPRHEDARRSRRRRHLRGAHLSRRRAGLLQLRGGRRCRSRWTPTACASTCSRRRSSGSERDGRRPKFIYTVPTFQNPAGVTLSLPRRKRLVEMARETRVAGTGGQPVRHASLRGRATAAAVRARRRRVRALPGHVLEDPLPRHQARLAGGARPRAGQGPARQAGGRPLHLLADPASGRRLLRARAAGVSTFSELCALYRERRDAMLDALAEFFPAEAEWTRPGGGLFIWATLPDFIDTHDLLAKALREEQVAFVPGAAAYVDGRGGSSMRLNFSSADADASARACAGSARSCASRSRSTEPSSAARRPELRATQQARATGRQRRALRAACRAAAPRSCRLPKRRARAPRRDQRMSARPGRRPEGRAVAGAPGLAALGGARRGRARGAGSRVVPIDVDGTLVRAAARSATPTSPSSPCTVAAARTARCRRSSRSSACPTPAPACRPASARWTRC